MSSAFSRHHAWWVMSSRAVEVVPAFGDVTCACGGQPLVLLIHRSTTTPLCHECVSVLAGDLIDELTAEAMREVRVGA